MCTVLRANEASQAEPTVCGMSWVRLKQRKSQINVWSTTAACSCSIMSTMK